MGWVAALACILLFQASPPQTESGERTKLYGADGVAAGFILYERYIFLWSGNPAAYCVDDARGGCDLYGFDTGKHLGWLEDGVVFDHRGYRVGAIAEKHPGPLKPDPVRRAAIVYGRTREKESAPDRPAFREKWSYIPLGLFLEQGSIR